MREATRLVIDLVERVWEYACDDHFSQIEEVQAGALLSSRPLREDERPTPCFRCAGAPPRKVPA